MAEIGFVEAVGEQETRDVRRWVRFVRVHFHDAMFDVRRDAETDDGECDDHHANQCPVGLRDERRERLAAEKHVTKASE